MCIEAASQNQTLHFLRLPICQEVFLWQNQISSKRPLNQAACILTTASSYFMIFWYWLSFSSSDNSDLWVAVKLVEISGQLLGRKMNIYGANSSFQIYWFTLACYQDSSPTWRLCLRQKQRLWATWESWPGWTLDFHWSLIRHKSVPFNLCDFRIFLKNYEVFPFWFPDPWSFSKTHTGLTGLVSMLIFRSVKGGKRQKNIEMSIVLVRWIFL